ncbi:hypothetical protein BC938DRAFT_471701 [Jimgerdemannia flammicorona]|uniref:F-box domain-containing protein n=1 Tax=Jimgerdemannia flammicorona TaxID=994334 RepID=A0A433QUH3_9FUNG|nr:hypothetical protein BC938DRAFT_471701 [Jimgerdemannia flammicorona]
MQHQDPPAITDTEACKPTDPPPPNQLRTAPPRHPFLLPELADLFCAHASDSDFYHLALTCKTLFPPAARFLWHTLTITTEQTAQLLARTLSQPAATTTLDYHDLVHAFDCRLILPEYQPLCVSLFSPFRFPHLVRIRLLISNVPLKSFTPLFQASRNSLTELVHSFPVTEDFAELLLTIPRDRLKTYCAPYRGYPDTTIDLIKQHSRSLRSVELSWAYDTIMLALARCDGLEEIRFNAQYGKWASHAQSLTAFCGSRAVASLVRLYVRDWWDLSDGHVELLAQRFFSQPYIHYHPTHLQQITTHCRHLRELRISTTPLHIDTALHPLLDASSRTTTLETLVLATSHLSPSFARRFLLEMPRLRELGPGPGWDEDALEGLAMERFILHPFSTILTEVITTVVTADHPVPLKPFLRSFSSPSPAILPHDHVGGRRVGPSGYESFAHT